MKPGKRPAKKNETSNDSGYNVKSLDMYRTSDSYKKRRTADRTENKNRPQKTAEHNDAGYHHQPYHHEENKSVVKKNTVKRIKRKRIKKKRVVYSKKTIALFLSMSITAVSVISSVGLLMYRYSLVSDMKYEINTLNNTLAQIKNHKKEIEVELESTNRSESIEQTAVDVLKMQYPAEEKIVYIKVD